MTSTIFRTLNQDWTGIQTLEVHFIDDQKLPLERKLPDENEIFWFHKIAATEQKTSFLMLRTQSTC